jgi:phosphopantothenoylcysteine decarboxylase / phosphopantothenate---cysteine ligase
MAKILLIITGSIASYKAIKLISLLESKNDTVTVILTSGAEKFITYLIIKSLCRAMVYRDEMFQEEHDPMLHINLARTHDIILVAPASANFIANIACGLANTLSLSCILATETPIILAPAMNPSMYQNGITQSNLSFLKEKNFQIIEPEFGVMACGEEGIGRYPSEERIVDFIYSSLLKGKKLKGKKVIVNLGSTHESIDPVRFIGNYSSGTQGMLIVNELLRRGYEVHVIAGHTTISLPKNVIRAHTADEMLKESINLLPADVYISAAAICDFKIKEYSASKIKKSTDSLKLEFVKNIDVVSEIAHHKGRPKLVVGFALESDNYEFNAMNKLKDKNIDLVVVNKAKYIGKDFNEFSICSADSYKELGTISKKDLARNLVDKLEKLLS